MLRDYLSLTCKEKHYLYGHVSSLGGHNLLCNGYLGDRFRSWHRDRLHQTCPTGCGDQTMHSPVLSLAPPATVTSRKEITWQIRADRAGVLPLPLPLRSKPSTIPRAAWHSTIGIIFFLQQYSTFRMQHCSTTGPSSWQQQKRWVHSLLFVRSSRLFCLQLWLKGCSEV